MEKNLIGEVETLLSTTALSDEALSYQQSYTPHPGSDIPYIGAPEELLVTSRAQLDGYFTEYSSYYDFDAMTEICGAYDEDWFANHDLLLVLIEASHPDNLWQIVDITEGSRWDWEVLVRIDGEFYPDQEEDCIHLLIELEKGIILPEDSINRITEPQPET